MRELILDLRYASDPSAEPVLPSHSRVAPGASANLAAYREGVAPVLERAMGYLEANAPDRALASLMSAHAMTTAQLTSLDILSVKETGYSLVASSTGASSPAGGGAAGPAPSPAPPPGSLQALFNTLGKVGAWLWSVIQSLLTPKSWSIEGGVGFPGLASAKMIVSFGN